MQMQKKAREADSTNQRHLQNLKEVGRTLARNSDAEHWSEKMLRHKKSSIIIKINSNLVKFV